MLWIECRNMLIGVKVNPKSPRNNVVRVISGKLLRWAFHSRKFEFEVFRNIHLNDRNASVNSKHQHPPRADPRGNLFKWSKTLPRGKIFLQKHGPRDKKTPTPGEYCERSSQVFLLVGVEILAFFRNQTLKRTGRLFKSYPLVSVYVPNLKF